MRETVFAGKAPPSSLNIVGTAGHTNKPLMDSYSVSLSLSNEPSYTLIGQYFITLTPPQGLIYRLPQPDPVQISPSGLLQLVEHVQ